MITTLISGSAQYTDGFIVSVVFRDPAKFALFRYGAKEFPLFLMLANGLSSAMLSEFSTREKMKESLEKIKVKSVSHITGGGFYENIPRSLPKGYSAKIDRSSLRIPLIFNLLSNTGKIPERDMFNTYNMGVGMSVIVAKEDADTALAVLRDNGENAYIMGEVVKSDEGVIIC